MSLAIAYIVVAGIFAIIAVCGIADSLKSSAKFDKDMKEYHLKFEESMKEIRKITENIKL